MGLNLINKEECISSWPTKFIFSLAIIMEFKEWNVAFYLEYTFLVLLCESLYSHVIKSSPNRSGKN